MISLFCPTIDQPGATRQTDDSQSRDRHREAGTSTSTTSRRLVDLIIGGEDSVMSISVSGSIIGILLTWVGPKSSTSVGVNDEGNLGLGSSECL